MLIDQLKVLNDRINRCQDYVTIISIWLFWFVSHRLFVLMKRQTKSLHQHQLKKTTHRSLHWCLNWKLNFQKYNQKFQNTVCNDVSRIVTSASTHYYRSLTVRAHCCLLINKHKISRSRKDKMVRLKAMSQEITGLTSLS